MTDKQKYPVYFFMKDETPISHSFMKMADDIYKNGFYCCEDKFQKIMFMSEKQKFYFMKSLLDTTIYFRDINDEQFEYAGFKISTIKGIKMADFDERIADLEKRLIALEERSNIACRIPHICPICSGRGSPFIQSDTCAASPRKHWIETNPCIGCEGKGIVWR